MLRHKIIATAAALTGLFLATQPAAAVEWLLDDSTPPPAWAAYKRAHPYARFTFHRQFYYRGDRVDPYAYVYEPVGYYPYYNTGDWKPRSLVPHRHAHFPQPHYYKAWGYSKHHFDSVRWHQRHDGAVDRNIW